MCDVDSECEAWSKSMQKHTEYMVFDGTSPTTIQARSHLRDTHPHKNRSSSIHLKKVMWASLERHREKVNATL